MVAHALVCRTGQIRAGLPHWSDTYWSAALVRHAGQTCAGLPALHSGTVLVGTDKAVPGGFRGEWQGRSISGKEKSGTKDRSGLVGGQDWWRSPWPYPNPFPGPGSPTRVFLDLHQLNN